MLCQYVWLKYFKNILTVNFIGTIILLGVCISMNLKDIRKQKGLSQAELAKKIGVSRSAVSMWEIGASQPDNDLLLKMSRLMNVSIDALLGNEPARTASTIPTASNIFPLKTKKVPLLGEIACGEPIFAEEEFGNYISTTDDIDADFCLRAKGDSMIGAGIHDGDIVFVKAADMVDNGKIAAVLIGDEATLKRVYFYPEKSKLVLSAENPEYEPFVYVGDELSEVRILGRAIAFQSLIR